MRCSHADWNHPSCQRRELTHKRIPQEFSPNWNFNFTKERKGSPRERAGMRMRWLLNRIETSALIWSSEMKCVVQKRPTSGLESATRRESFSRGFGNEKRKKKKNEFFIFPEIYGISYESRTTKQEKASKAVKYKFKLCRKNLNKARKQLHSTSQSSADQTCVGENLS